MATFGRIKTFDPSVETWSYYVERLIHYINANSITDERKKKAILNSYSTVIEQLYSVHVIM